MHLCNIHDAALSEKLQMDADLTLEKAITAVWLWQQWWWKNEHRNDPNGSVDSSVFDKHLDSTQSHNLAKSMQRSTVWVTRLTISSNRLHWQKRSSLFMIWSKQHFKKYFVKRRNVTFERAKFNVQKRRMAKLQTASSQICIHLQNTLSIFKIYCISYYLFTMF